MVARPEAFLTHLGIGSVRAMAGGLYDSSLTRVRPFFGALIARDPSGHSWLAPLLAAAPHGAALLKRLDGDAGTLLSALTVPSVKGYLGCFEYPVAAPSELLAWFIEHPDELVWPGAQTYSTDTTKWRRALLYDEPPGRAAAHTEARAAVQSGASANRAWWCFEGRSMLDCVLLTDRLVVTVEGKRTEPISAATDWYPKRSQLVRNLEAAKQLSNGRTWASLLISEQPVEQGADAGLDVVLADSAPHLDGDGHRELAAAYLGNLTWAQACAATGLDPGSLPATTAEL